jgi:pimeloyl-[acyl-carrier protein] methyl ester esterase
MNVILMPGMDGTGALFAPFLRVLPENYAATIIRYPTQELLNYDQLLEFVWPQLPIGEPFLLIAESFSGPLAVKIAARHPEGLRGLVLCATFCRCPVRLTAPWMRTLLQPMWFSLTPHWLKVSALLGSRPDPALRALLQESLSAVPAAVMNHRARAILCVDVREELLQCDVPMVALHAKHDRLVPPHALREFQRLRPSIRTVVIDAPHLLLQTAPGDALRAIQDAFTPH